MRFIAGLALVPLATGALLAGAAADVAARIDGAGLNPEECYRVRDLALSREDLRFYFTEGYLMFGKPAGEAPLAAVFIATVQGGDAEVLTLPPTRSERQSLAGFTGSPNLDEHFQAAVLLFTDQTYRDLMAQIRENPVSNKKSREMGLALAPDWNAVVRNLTASFENRLVLDLLSGPRQEQGLFFAAIRGLKLGNFDVISDTRSRQQITVGQIAFRNNVSYFDVWTTFEARSIRNGAQRPPGAEFELSDFRIDATLVPPDLRLQVVTRVKLKPKDRALAAAPFELSRQMRVTAASIDGQPVEVFERESMRSNLIHDHGNYLFVVVPTAPLDPGREYEFEFKHDGAVISDAGNKVFAVGSRANWYPSRGLQFASYDATFRYPRDLDLVSAGEVISDSTADDLRVTRRRTTAPIRMLGFNLGVYERAKITRGKETVEVCANQSVERALQPRPAPTVRAELPPIAPPIRGRQAPPVLSFPDTPPVHLSPAARLRELADDVASAVDFMTARFGPPPLPLITVSPVPGAFGQGFPGLIYLSTLSYLRPTDNPFARLTEGNRLFFTELLSAHEIAHQWWGNVVASSGYQHDWLLEALANYSALMYLEKHKGGRALDSVLSEYRDDLLKKKDTGRTVESAGPIALGYRLETSQNPEAWRVIAYEKGSWILHMMRRLMGDQRFDSFLGELRKKFERQTLDTEGFRLLAARFLPSKSADPKLEAFFDQWVYSTGIPTLRMKYSLAGKAPAQKLTVTVEQSGVDEDFGATVPVEIQIGRLKPITRLVRTASEPVVFTIPVRQPPTKVSLDPAGSVLALKK